MTKKITYGAAAAALSALCVILAGTLPTGRLALIFFSSLFVYVLTGRGCYVAGIISFLAAAAVALLVCANKSVCAPYIGLLGHFGIFKPYIDKKIGNNWLRFLILLVYCNFFFFLTYFICAKVFMIDLFSYFEMSAVWLILIVEAMLAAFIVTYGFCQKMYNARLARFIK